jgi:hypothetical protein
LIETTTVIGLLLLLSLIIKLAIQKAISLRN